MLPIDEIDINALAGLTQDSRKVQPGFLFAALPGTKTNGVDYIDSAIKAGATHILAPQGTPSPEGAALITDENPARAFALLAAKFYGKQPGYIAAITGTNGKTSIASFCRQIWGELAIYAASMGTLGVQSQDVNEKGSMTTPDTITLHESLKQLVEVGVTHLAMEASSHGLAQYRLDGVKISAAGFTNLSRDHLDYHETMEAYLAAKARLFSELLDGPAVLNADIPEYEQLKSLCKDVISYGVAGQDLKIEELSPTAHGQIIRLKAFGKDYEVNLPLPGAFQAMNALCAAGLVMAEERENEARNDDIIAALEKLKGAPGRMQLVEPKKPKEFSVYIDYAHTPDALENTLNALRPHAQGKLVCVFGCGGDRDKGKRPQMGEISTRLADVTYVTDDNPRSEDPATIRAEIKAGAKGAKEIADREQAIKTAIENLSAGDLLVIAGKGHEQGQIIGDRIEPFDDYKVARDILNQGSK